MIKIYFDQSYLDHDHYADPNVNYNVMESILITALNPKD